MKMENCVTCASTMTLQTIARLDATAMTMVLLCEPNYLCCC